MRAELIDVALPRTDAGAAVQAVCLIAAYVPLALVLRHHRDLLLLVTGLAVMTAGLFALRTVH